MKYFADVRGAIDGTHITAHIPVKFQTPFRNRKGTLSQNVLWRVGMESWDEDGEVEGESENFVEMVVLGEKRKAERTQKNYLSERHFRSHFHFVASVRGRRTEAPILAFKRTVRRRTHP